MQIVLRMERELSKTKMPMVKKILNYIDCCLKLLLLVDKGQLITVVIHDLKIWE